jgi:C-terminal processing protease CtpA/Prc
MGDKIIAIDGTVINADSEYLKIINEARQKKAKGVELTIKSGNSDPRRIQLDFGGYDLNPPLRGKLVSDEIGLIELPQFGASLTDPKKAQEVSNEYAEKVQALIRELDQKNLIGWIIDLRQNNGGNMWPMLAGIGPILGEGEVGAFVSATGTNNWGYRDGKSVYDKEVVSSVASPYKVKKGDLPVAILTDFITASSAEAIVIAFKGRNKTRYFGMATGGLPTANTPFKLSDGAVLNLTVAVDADRTGKTYDTKIPPDTEVKTNWATYGTDDDDVIKIAIQWLRSQK